jgi:hypothetical protein
VPYPAFNTGFCSDEDIARRAEADYMLLAPRSQRMAYGIDGAFSPSNVWTLTSATNNFVTQKVVSNMIVCLTAAIPKGFYAATGTLFAIDSVSSAGATLRGIGLGTGDGLPPSPAGGLTGVEFRIFTLQPQIVTQTYDLYQRFGIDPNFALLAPSNLYDPTELIEAAVLGVLRKQYAAMSREPDDTFARKAKDHANAMNEVLDRIVVKMQGQTSPTENILSRFSTRLTR